MPAIPTPQPGPRPPSGDGYDPGFEQFKPYLNHGDYPGENLDDTDWGYHVTNRKYTSDGNAAPKSPMGGGNPYGPKGDPGYNAEKPEL